MSETAREYVEGYFASGPYEGELFLADLEKAGFVIVPKEPTRAMLSAVADEPDAKDTWGRMIAAAKGTP